MTLFRQIAVIMSVLVVILLAITMASNYRTTGSFIRDQLYSNARNTASSLGLAIGKSGADRAMIETMINAVFDSGYYERIAYTDLKGNVIYERKAPLKIKDVPEWFVKRVHLRSTEASVPVSRNWRMIGKLKIRGHRGHAYEQLWTAFTEVVAAFFVLSLLALATIYFLLKIVLRSLRKVREQAEAVVGNRFVVQESIPRTREFGEVVRAMNALVVKVKEIYRREAEAMARYNELRYKDAETGFFNRNYFRVRLGAFLQSHDRYAEGYLMALQIRGYDERHKTEGANAVHALVLRLRDLLLERTQTLHDAVLCRTRESDFVIVLPSTGEDAMRRDAEAVAGACAENGLPVTTAVIPYHEGETLSEVLSEMDNALMMAAAEESPAVFHYRKEVVGMPSLGHDAWLSKLHEALQKDAFIPMLQPVKNERGAVLHEEVLLRLELDGEMYNAGRFIPIVAGVGMLAELDRYVVSKLERLGREQKRLAVNVTYEFVSHSSAFFWLDTLGAKWDEAGMRVSFEMSNGAVARDAEAAEAFAAHVRERGWRFGIDHFTVGSYDLHLLQKLRPDYLKIDAAYLSALIGNEEEQGRRSALFTITSLLDIRLVATGVDADTTARRLYANGVEWLQGFYVAQPRRGRMG